MPSDARADDSITPIANCRYEENFCVIDNQLFDLEHSRFILNRERFGA